jgi:hypothetical protein
LINDPDPERKFKEVVLLRQKNETTIFVRKTLNGKFTVPGWQASYCPEKMQVSYREAQRRGRDEQKAEAAQKKAKPRMEKWHPKDGVYASPGADFNDRCLKSGDLTIGLAENSVSSGEAKCKIFKITDGPPDPDAIVLDMTCNQPPGEQTDIWRKLDGQTALETPSKETMILRKIDDNTFFLLGTQNAKFTGPGGPRSYCPEDVQRMYRDQNAKK